MLHGSRNMVRKTKHGETHKPGWFSYPSNENPYENDYIQ